MAGLETLYAFLVILRKSSQGANILRVLPCKLNQLLNLSLMLGGNIEQMLQSPFESIHAIFHSFSLRQHPVLL